MQESARIFSLLMQVMMIAPITAPLLGGFLLEHGSWRLIFWTLCGLGLAGFAWGLVALPDSQPKAQRAPLNLGNIVYAYARQMRRTAFMTYTVAGGFILSSLFTYISASAFIFTQHFTLSPIQFSYLFAANSVGLVIGGFLSNQLLKYGWSARLIMLVGMGLHAAFGLGLFMLAQAEQVTLVVYGSLLALAISALGLIFGNLTALTMADAGKQAGVASALMGVMHYVMAAGIGYVVSLAAAEITSLPATIALCGVLALTLCLSIRHPQPQENHPLGKG
jgi:DHA1 family bicyclomycin/chloramphenicol resistance-like MFS transporter